MAIYAAITPSDSTVYSPPIVAIWVGQAGNLALQAEGDTAPVTLMNVPVGLLHVPYECARVMATGTTAGELVGFQVG